MESLTDEVRQEMQNYKYLAMEIENKLKLSKENNPDTESMQSKDISGTSFSEDCNKKVLNLLDDTVEEHNEIVQSFSYEEKDLISFEDDDIIDDVNDSRDDSTSNYIYEDFDTTADQTDKENVIRIQKLRKKKSFSMHKLPIKRCIKKRSVKSACRFSSIENFDSLMLNGNIEEILQRFQRAQFNKILELNKKQKKEQETLLRILEKDQVKFFNKIRTSLTNLNSDKHPSSSSSEIIKKETNLSLSNQTLYLTTNSSIEDDMSTVVQKLISKSKIVKPLDNSQSVEKPLIPVSVIEPSKDEDKKIWAANIINAFARGFFVRRLMRTNKVVNIIKTLKDSLSCLRDLYCEDSNNLNESDLHLSGRLMHQIEAACYSFYKIFFELSTSEKLKIIRLDRQMLLEKKLKIQMQNRAQKRPHSSSTSSSRRSLILTKSTVSESNLNKLLM